MKKITTIILLFICSICFSQTLDSITFKFNNGDITYAIANKSFVGSGIRAYSLLGSDIKAQTVDFPISYCNTSSALTDNQVRFTALIVQKTETITGVNIYIRAVGTFTADNNNRVGLYSYNNGTLTLVASSVNDANLYKSGLNTFLNIPFSSAYTAQRGIYFVGVLYNNSAQTTAPSISSGTALGNAAMANPKLTNSAKLYGILSAQNDLPATVNMSAITAATAPTWIALY